ncbi:hypothetical protein NKH18_46000 [Streptomyces sp. M10(2022)]
MGGAGGWDPAAVRAEAVQGPGGAWHVTGTKEYVLDGWGIDVLLVAARTQAGVSLFQVAVDGPGTRREPVVTMDLTRSQARWVLDGRPAGSSARTATVSGC